MKWEWGKIFGGEGGGGGGGRQMSDSRMGINLSNSHDEATLGLRKGKKPTRLF